MATHGGAADSYYSEGASNPNQMQYAPPPQQQMQYPPQAAGNGYEPKYQQPPPNYGQDFQNTGAPPMGPPPMGPGGKQTFDQAFKLDKPKYNDLWAGILVRFDCIISRAQWLTVSS